MLRFKSSCFIIAILLFITEVLIALYAHDQIIRPYFGDVLVVILLYFLMKSFLNWSVIQTCSSVLLFAYLIEILQYFNFVHRLGLANSKIANVILGSYFAWMDILAYTLGILIVLSIEWLKVSNQRPYKKRRQITPVI